LSKFFSEITKGRLVDIKNVKISSERWVAKHPDLAPNPYVK